LKDAVKEDQAVAEAKLASTDTELAELQLLQQQVTDLNTRAEQIKTFHIKALKEADERPRNLERAKAESDGLSRQLSIRESSNTRYQELGPSIGEVVSMMILVIA